MEETITPDMIHWMREAQAQALKAKEKGEVPVGAVIVYQGECIAVAGNSVITNNDPSAHAELLALRQAGKVLNNYRLNGCQLYVTLEPCAMCSGCIIHARIAHLIYGAREPKAGVAHSHIELFSQPFINHRPKVTGGVLEQENRVLLEDFFRQKRST